jgi:hypothetical protein
MFTSNRARNLSLTLAAVALLVAAPVGVWAQDESTKASLDVKFPKDSPVSVVSVDSGDSHGSARGGALMLYLNSTLTLRNSGHGRIRGVTLLVRANDFTAGGKASVTVPSLDVAPGETFPVHVELSVMSPLQAGANPAVEVDLDGVLFDDLSFYGPNRLNSRRAMTVWEMEARRDRRYFLAVLEKGGPEALQNEVLASLKREAESPQLGLRVRRTGRATNQDPEHRVQFAFLNLPGAPIEPVAGFAEVTRNEVHMPRLEVQNTSEHAIRHLELGWMLRDGRGRDYMAGAIPADVALNPGQRATIVPQSDLAFTQRTGGPLQIDGLSAYVSNVEFADGTVWIPERSALRNPLLNKVLAPSAEEERLVGVYRRKGLNALVDELKRLK